MAADLDLVVRARRAVVHGSRAEVACSLGVADGRIAAITAYDDPPAAARTVALGDDEVLLPGLVDTHVHVNEPGRTEWEGFASATRAAAAGGVTTLLDMPLNSIPPTVTVEALRAKQDAARGQVVVDVGFWGGAVPDHLDDLASLHAAGVFGFKCFLLDSGVPEFPPLSPSQLVEAMTETSRLDALLIAHAEDATMLREELAAGPSYAGFLASRPSSAEDAAVALVIDAAQATGGRAHVVHLSSADALSEIEAAKETGVDLTVETCPHYLALDADEVPDGATEFKCCPPIRSAANRDRLWEGLHAGTIDFVVSDHSPCTVELKERGGGDFGRAWGGIASVQLGLPVVWTAARARGLGLGDVVRWMATGPADRVGLGHKGRLVVGADADLCVLAPEETFVVDPARLHHRHPVSAYAGRTLAGVVRQTWLRGAPIDGSAPAGRLLERGRR